jgi:hypothetical protein
MISGVYVCVCVFVHVYVIYSITNGDVIAVRISSMYACMYVHVCRIARERLHSDKHGFGGGGISSDDFRCVCMDVCV